ncbi:MAG: serine/threonine protein kinase, partial [Myxococcales bacterium]|nr:serine/threonine protein kinase [Myxococcales bacterium]
MEPGTLVAERFEIEREAGSGGMGTVYRARDRHRGEIVALKLLRSVDPRDLARFTREARTLAALHHPGIVRYVDHGVAPGGDVWLAMEWLEGEGLDRRLRRGLRLDEALEIALGAAEALAPAHRRGVIHRDLKPGNLFLVGGDPKRVKVIDFGIARALGAETRVTTTGTAVGTPNYMSPEQARGAQELDCRTDVYSLGCVLYEMLCGEPPFCGDSAIAVLAKILLEQPRPLRDRNEAIPAVLDALVLRLLAKDPQERPANAAALVEALGQVEAAALAAGSVRPGPMALGEEERRLVCVVLVPAPGGGGARTLPASPASAGAGLGRIRDRISALGGKLEVLAEGSLIATVPSRGVATDQAARPAR